MKKQILILSLALSMNALHAQTTTPDKKKGTDTKGTEQDGTKKGTKQTTDQNGTLQNGTQKGTQQNGNQTGQPKGMRQGMDESESYNSITPPSTISDKFNSENPGRDVKWRMDGENYSGEFLDNSTNMNKNVVYDKNGNVIRTDNEMNADGMNYPSAIGDYHSKNFPNEGYKVWSTDDGKGNKWFYTKRKNGTIWFDKDGKYFPGKSAKVEEKKIVK